MFYSEAEKKEKASKELKIHERWEKTMNDFKSFHNDLQTSFNQIILQSDSNARIRNTPLSNIIDLN